jgi:pimeloyl-ACP methyl ester carboxylesterase
MNNKYHVSNQRMYSTTTLYRTVTVDGLSIFYREAGDQSNPKLVLLHGFPASSHQYRNLVIASTYTMSVMPSR